MPNDGPDALSRYAAFISYAREDEAFAKQLETEIEAHHRPGIAQVHVFRDRSDFTGSAYESALETHLRDSATLIVVCSPDARKSKFVGDEIKRFASLHGVDRIFPVLVSGLPDNEADDKKAFPSALVEVMQGRGMPLGAEYRGLDLGRERVSGGRFEGEWYKLLANIYGATSSEIREEDQRRLVQTQRRRLAIGGAAVLMLLAVLGGVFWLWRRAVQFEQLFNAESDRSQTALSAAQNELERLRAQVESSRAAGSGSPAEPPPPTPTEPRPGPSSEWPTEPGAPAGLRARVYFHIRNDQQRPDAENLRRVLEAVMRDVGVPGIQRLDVGPVRTSELRFFFDDDRAEAERITKFLQGKGVTDLVAKKIQGYSQAKMRPRHFELWLKPDTGATP